MPSRLSAMAVLVVLHALALAPTPAHAERPAGQPDEQRANQQRGDEQRGDEQRRGVRQIELGMRDIITPVVIENAPAKSAFEWWSQVTRIPLIINWDAMAYAGIDDDKRISLRLRSVPAGQLLSLLMSEITTEDVTLLYEVTPWYVRVLTKDEANKKTVIRIYEIRDITMDIPSFSSAPSFSINAALSNTSSGGSTTSAGGNNRQSIFSDDDDDDQDRLSPGDRGERLANLVRDTIEPDIWQANGGEYASIRYLNGKLIVKAPKYVHAQIGLPTQRAPRGVTTTRRSTGSKYYQAKVRSRHAAQRKSKISAVRDDTGPKVSGVQD